MPERTARAPSDRRVGVVEQGDESPHRGPHLHRDDRRERGQGDAGARPHGVVPVVEERNEPSGVVADAFGVAGRDSGEHVDGRPPEVGVLHPEVRERRRDDAARHVRVGDGDRAERPERVALEHVGARHQHVEQRRDRGTDALGVVLGDGAERGHRTDSRRGILDGQERSQHPRIVGALRGDGGNAPEAPARLTSDALGGIGDCVEIVPCQATTDVRRVLGTVLDEASQTREGAFPDSVARTRSDVGREPRNRIDEVGCTARNDVVQRFEPGQEVVGRRLEEFT